MLFRAPQIIPENPLPQKTKGYIREGGVQSKGYHVRLLTLVMVRQSMGTYVTSWAPTISYFARHALFGTPFPALFLQIHDDKIQ